MAIENWPRWDGGPTLEQYAEQQLKFGDSYPFDEALEGEKSPNRGEDWAIRAARGIISEFGDRGASFNEALHPEKVDHETRIEIIEVMAEIMRRALAKATTTS